MSKWKQQDEFNTLVTRLLKQESDLLKAVTEHIAELEARIEKLEEKSPAGDAAGKVVKAFLDRLMEREDD